MTTVSDPAGVPHGLTVNSFTSVSLDPPLVLVCVDYGCNILPQFQMASHFGVNILKEDQRELSVRFAIKGHDRFDGVAWSAAASGAPRLDGVLGFLECRLVRTVEAGDHAILIGEVESSESHHGRPLLYYGSTYRALDAG